MNNILEKIIMWLFGKNLKWFDNEKAGGDGSESF